MAAEYIPETKNHYGSGFDLTEVLEEIRRESGNDLDHYRRLGPTLEPSDDGENQSAT